MARDGDAIKSLGTGRLFRSADGGAVYRVNLAPCENTRGIDPEVDAVVFEDTATGRVQSARLYRGWALEELTDRDLRELLEDAT